MSSIRIPVQQTIAFDPEKTPSVVAMSKVPAQLTIEFKACDADLVDCDDRTLNVDESKTHEPVVVLGGAR